MSIRFMGAAMLLQFRRQQLKLSQIKGITPVYGVFSFACQRYHLFQIQACDEKSKEWLVYVVMQLISKLLFSLQHYAKLGSDFRDQSLSIVAPYSRGALTAAVDLKSTAKFFSD